MKEVFNSNQFDYNIYKWALDEYMSKNKKKI